MAYIRGLTENPEFVAKTKFVTSFSPFVLRNCAMHDPFLNDIYNSKGTKVILMLLPWGYYLISTIESEEYFSKIVGEELRWLSNTWDASHMNVQASRPLAPKLSIINVTNV